MEKVEKDKHIKKELSAMQKMFKSIEKDKQKMVNSLIQQAAFMKVTLDELQEIINTSGAVENFINGSQKMLREHPALKSYNTTMKNYSHVIEQLITFLPEGEETDELTEFLKNRK